MRIALCSIQRNRGPWLLEWFAFHSLMGVTDFIIYLHRCEDDSAEIVTRLSTIFRVRCFVVDIVAAKIQLSCYQHALDTFSNEFDWIAFIDGDEFLFPTRDKTLPAALAPFDALQISALGIYWRCFGSSGHVNEPKGLVTEKYRRCSRADFVHNQHIKSVVRGRIQASTQHNAHVFATPNGTFDENLRPVSTGLVIEYAPSWHIFRINHYVTQSRSYFEKVKQTSGAADASPDLRREEEYWTTLDRNEEYDRSLEWIAEPLAARVQGLCQALKWDSGRLGGLPYHIVA